MSTTGNQNKCTKEMDGFDGRPIYPEMIFTEDCKANMTKDIRNIQINFCEEIEKLEESTTFSTHRWTNSKGAGGKTMILENGDVFEKVAVSRAVASGNLSKSMFLLLNKKIDSDDFPQNPTYFTAGVNGVAYPKNPNVPTLNFSYRYFEMKDGNKSMWWFAGGTDLIPYILKEEDCLHFHKVLKICCDKFDKNYYRTFKKSCDQHFYLEHRGESRGIGGIFFNELNSPNQEICFKFVSTCMKNIIPSYRPIVIKNKDKKYFSEDKEWQLLQRGRSVEYNFICDKTTKLLLMTSGVEYENVLISLPPCAKWQYNYVPSEKSKESELLNILRNPVEWV